MDPLEAVRPLSFAIAYRMLGSVAEAEDVVQEALIRFDDADEVENPDAFITTVTTRLAIDTLKSARVRREVYVGSWLPEPLVDDFSAQQQLESEETISTAFLMLLEELNPAQRAVLVLREAFNYEFSEIGEIIGKSEANCRQILSRAKHRIGGDEPRYEADPEQSDQLASRFLDAAREGSLDDLVELLADDVVMTGDGGGKARAIVTPMTGALKVGRALHSFKKMAEAGGVELNLCRVNGRPGIRAIDREGRIVSVISLDSSDGRIQKVSAVVNPDKLGHLGLVSDFGLRPDYLDRRPDRG